MVQGEHIQHQFDDELEQVKRQFMKMGGLVETQLRKLLEGIEKLDSEPLMEAKALDKKINALESSIDEDCALIIVRRQPKAGDMRLIMSLLRGLFDLERCGDENKKIARLSLNLIGEDGFRRNQKMLIGIGESVLDMLRQALDAFARGELKVAYDLAKHDKDVDEQCANATLRLAAQMGEAQATGFIPSGLDMLLILRALERIGDHACNLTEHIVYMVRGQDVRHIDIDKMKKTLRKNRD